MSMPIAEQPPAVVLPEQSYSNHTGHPSIGPVIAVVVIIIILGGLAGMIGRLCSGRRIMGYGDYDIGSWAERKCSSCIDGRISPSPPRPEVSATSTPVTLPVQANQDPKSEELSPQNPASNTDSS
ncbi:hypothetical protein HS088_TW06G01247 [Tripterygium wilfordii]|uniref:Transmembrane protein n=1 Tax=Tripterygium wilfordii TaxID=458696 RepID=A0A7J7DLC4_TRIWF|nr:uncharacterized protein LOC119999372 [Tripterygium wilfordii]KAF5747069.1 hypothetical protein HS088_TW06G01247 [Tripterygium wilfordii]